MNWPAWIGVGERRWQKSSPNEEVQPGKTLWDFLQLLIVPALLAGFALWFNAEQASREHSREDRRIHADRAIAEASREDATLDAYLAEIRDLMLNRHLQTAEPYSPVSQVARTETLVALHRLNGERKGDLIRFLNTAALIDCRCTHDFDSSDLPPISLDGADLRGADLRGGDFLHSDNFSGADLRRARFEGATLLAVTFNDDDLRGASFNGTEQSNVFFSLSDLRGARFDDAVFEDTVLLGAACLSNTSLVRTTLSPKTSFAFAYGRNLDLRGAKNLTHAQTRKTLLFDVRLDEGAPRPEGWGPKGPRQHPPLDPDSKCARLSRGQPLHAFG